MLLTLLMGNRHVVRHWIDEGYLPDLVEPIGLGFSKEAAPSVEDSEQDDEEEAHYFNATISSCEQIITRNVLPKELGVHIITTLYDEDEPVIHYSAVVGDVEGLKGFLAFGVHKDDLNSAGATPMHFSCLCGEVKCAQILLEAGATVDALDASNNTPLHYAAAYGRNKCVALLLEYGADATIQNIVGNTPIDVARLNNQHKPLKFLEIDGFL
ncbi:hypothetical protein Tsubulata_042518 [Turnera subulata]|uniref:Uncharacterized protein n=1 Tax=Turnera subulata TaxID=218843 RepID=A0A9Q0FXB4_9ROSI|nr:hypothetical protein Tsubulata_042518 [Turnera subulata]